ncbi:hypothetical protein DPEC_G00283020 [Dallia pectoralis]|uniref:Uncharacterized protein n=1 Tax=Dallia pectoralis TaxID=75939 RepID=A0ACC2FJ57_DALPE|nr:hypothetical protein DPEC_G00283020 [Dallia pectoralis]
MSFSGYWRTSCRKDLRVSFLQHVTDNPTTWSRQLVWVEYAHNTLNCSSTGFSHFKCFIGYQPLLFPEQEEEVGVPSAQLFVRQCR